MVSAKVQMQSEDKALPELVFYPSVCLFHQSVIFIVTGSASKRIFAEPGQRTSPECTF
jgi:hypothetical protein